MQKRGIRNYFVRYFSFLLLGCLMVTSAGCSNLHTGASVIDWIDFVKTDDGMYLGLSNGVLRDPDSVTQDVLGTVKKKLDGNVHNSAYVSNPETRLFWTQARSCIG
ncbi:hypothetical protein [Saccharibacillus sacchari]|uniref:Uncharacterized protein n=1 Tax=Saccharibacillus sacchari TaxID=456493 RepID=A0ACC6PGQ9_9BACL